jgi:hypothetical protein
MFSNILDMNLTFFFMSCKCVAHNKLLQRIFFFYKKNLFSIFKLSIFVGKLSKFLPVFQRSFTLNSFRIRSCSDPEDFFRIRILL